MPFDSIGELLPLTIFVLIPLIQWIRQLLSRQPEQMGAENAEPHPQPRPRPRRPLPPPEPLPPDSSYPARQTQPRPPRQAPPRPAAPPDSEAPQRAPEPVVSSPRARLRVGYGAALHRRATLRNAIAIMTILGPCRALSPFDSDGLGGH